jgi:hypothetical protein
MKKSELRKLIREEIQKINEELNDDKLYWIAIKLNMKKSSWAILGFKDEKSANKAEDKFNSISDIQVFNVDNYGLATESEIRKNYKPIVHLKKVSRNIDNTSVGLIYTVLLKFGV